MNFIIELKVITESGVTMKRERLVIAENKDEAYDMFFAHPFIRNYIAKCNSFSVSLRMIDGI